MLQKIQLARDVWTTWLAYEPETVLEGALIGCAIVGVTHMGTYCGLYLLFGWLGLI